MAFLHGKASSVFINATNLSSYLNSAQVTAQVGLGETTAFGATSKAYLVGLKDGSISLGGMFDGATAAIDPVIQALLATTTTPVFSYFEQDSTIGNPGILAQGDITQYSVSSPVGDVVSVQVDVQVSGGTDRAVSLHAIATSETATANSASVDNAASTTNGGVGHIHVVTNANAGTTIIKTQHSADNSTWADLITFSTIAITTTGWQRTVVSTGTTVNRYLRSAHALGGAGAVTFAHAFARR